MARLDRSETPGKGAARTDDPQPDPQQVRRKLARGVHVAVDDRPPVRVDATSTGVEIAALPLDGPHRVVITGSDGERVASFTFTFAEYESDVVCVYDNAFYATWRIKRADNRDRCRCTDQPRKLRERNGMRVL